MCHRRLLLCSKFTYSVAHCVASITPFLRRAVCSMLLCCCVCAPSMPPQHNLVGYEAEDESEGQLAWSKPQDDPDQTTWWDDTKRASKLLACRTYTGARKAGAAALEAASKAGARLRAQAAASAAAAASTSSSSAGGGGSGTAGAAAPAASKPATAPSSGTGSTSTPANSGGSSSSSSTGSADSSADAAPVPPSSSNKEAAPWSQ